MKAYVSLHSGFPSSQSEHEVSYSGYARMEIDFTPDFGKNTIVVEFPEILETVYGTPVTHVCIGYEQSLNGRAEAVIETIPNIPLLAGHKPKVIFANIPEPLPDELNPFVRLIWELANDREIDPADLHPAIFEAVNDHLHAHGVPVLKCIRCGTARMDVKMSQMRSMNTAGNA